MNRHNGSGLRGDGGLYLIWVYATGLFFNINEYRLAAIPPNTVSSCYKTIRRGYDLTSYT